MTSAEHSEIGMSVAEWVGAGATYELPLAWLAGYPRSGAALVRTILAHCFGHRTGTIYSEADLGEEYNRTLHALPRSASNSEVAALAQRQGLLTFKTHERAEGIGHVPTIIIVRDGRRMFESLLAFYRERNAVEYTMTELIEGTHHWGDWTDWIRSWAGGSRRDTQWLRYEDIMADVPGTVARLAARWGIKPIGHEIPAFETMQATTPTIFRKAEVSGNGGMTDEEEAEFWTLHGGTMTMLGYRR